MVLKRLAGRTENTAPVLALITQFGGGKTHTLTTLYHLIKHSHQLEEKERFKKMIREAGLSKAPDARVAVFVGDAWDPAPVRKIPGLI